MRTSLFTLHNDAGAKIVDFAGWEMPLHYGSQITEHHAVRTKAGCFDVSHMGVVDIAGPDAKRLLKYLLTSDIDRLQEVGQSFYTLMLNEEGGILEDLIVYRMSECYRAIINAATKESDLAHINEIREKLQLNHVDIVHRHNMNIVAIQGPDAVEIVSRFLQLSDLSSLDRFRAISHREYFIARTGYTGEDGVEVVCDDKSASHLWSAMLDAGVQPCGLAARDSLRLEAGLNLNTVDMNASIVPDEANLKWTVHSESGDRNFHGKIGLELRRAETIQWKLTGLVAEGKGIVRHGYEVHTPEGSGTITSGLFSPTLGYSIGLARVPISAKGSCKVKVRRHEIDARLVRPPFVRNGVKVHK